MRTNSRGHYRIKSIKSGRIVYKLIALLHKEIKLLAKLSWLDWLILTIGFIINISLFHLRLSFFKRRGERVVSDAVIYCELLFREQNLGFTEEQYNKEISGPKLGLFERLLRKRAIRVKPFDYRNSYFRARHWNLKYEKRQQGKLNQITPIKFDDHGMYIWLSYESWFNGIHEKVNGWHLVGKFEPFGETFEQWQRRAHG